MLLLVVFFLIEFEAIYEALFNRAQNTHDENKRKFWFLMSEITELIYRAIITMIVLAWLLQIPPWFFVPAVPYIKALFAYLFIRYGLFDTTYNPVAGNELFYIGSNKWYDRAWRWFFDKTHLPPVHFLWITKLIFTLLGIAWLLNL